MTSKPLPPVVRIEPASACNLRCTHCPTGVVEASRTVMKAALFNRVLSEITKHVPPIRVAVLYHGGEPFLNKHFLSMASQVKALGIPLVKTVSNGMLIKRQICDAIVTSGLDEIEISIDGDSPDENNLVRQRSNCDHIVTTVKDLVTANIRHGRRLKITIATTQFRSLGSFDPQAEAPVPVFLNDAFSDVIDEIHFKSTWARMWPSGQPASGFDLLHDNRSRPPVHSCNMLEETISIRADGTVVACCYDLLTESNLGNIAQQTLEEIWNGPAYRSFREGFAAANYPALCGNCAVVTGDKYLIPKTGTGQQRMFKITV